MLAKIQKEVAFKRVSSLVVGLAALCMACLAQATIVQFQTSLGTFEVNLYDEETPLTVANFLAYVSDDRYEDTIIHRSVDDFIIQGGAITLGNDNAFTPVRRFASIQNEPFFSNVRGTIAMAKLSNNVNSATSQWFINTSNNSANLDIQNGGFTVFGEVISGMDVVDAINNLEIFNTSNVNGLFSAVPLTGFSQDDITNQRAPEIDDYVYINSIVVLDAASDTAADLNPAKNTLIESSDGGGGSVGLFSLLLLAFLSLVSLNIRHRRA